MLLTKGSREDAIHALINVWLKDTTKSCGWCGVKYLDNKNCCEQPFITTNANIFRQFYEELKRDRETRNNDFASTDDKSVRWTLSFPPGLLEFLTISFKRQYQEDLFSKEYDTNWFAKKFGKYFSVPRKI